MHLHLADADVAAELGLVEEPPDPQARGAHQPPEIGQALHRAQRLQIALEVGLHVACEPDGTRRLVLQFVRRNRETAQARRGPPVLARAGVRGERLAPAAEARPEELAPGARASEPMALAPRERPERDVHRAPGERLAEALEHEEIRRGGEHEAAGFARPVTVHRALHGDEQVARALHLVEHERGRALEHGLGIGRGLGTQVEVVEREVGPARERRKRPQQRGLAALARAEQDHHRRRARGARERCGCGAGEDGGGGSRFHESMIIIHSMSVQGVAQVRMDDRLGWWSRLL